MSSCELETILVVCADADQSAEILGRLHDGGMSAVGPAPTAGLALALTAQVTPRAAILAGQTMGRRDADALARELSATWGVECFVLPQDGEVADAADVVTGRTGTLRRVLRSPALRPAVIN